MIAKIKTFQRSQFVRNVAIVATGTAGAQAITMAFSPLITRLYGPEAFGLLGVFMAILAILTPIAAFTYPTAIVLPKSDTDAKGLIKLSIILAFGLAFVTAIILLIAGKYLLKLVDSESIIDFMMFIPLVIFFTALFQITQQWLIRKKQYKTTAKIADIQALIVNSAKTGLGWLNPTASMLIIVTTFGSLLHAMMMFAGISKNKDAHANDNTRSKTVAELAKEHKDFPLFQAPQQLLNAVSQSAPVLMFAGLYGPASAGLYSIGMLVLSVPSSLIGQSVGNVFYPRMAEASHNGENLINLLSKATKALALIGIIPFGLVLLFGPLLFGFVFGSEWEVAGEYARWLSLWLYFSFMNPPSIKAIIILKMQQLAIALNIITLGLRVGAILIGAYIFENVLYSVAFFVIAGILHNIIFIILAFWGAKKHDNKAKVLA